ncbi:MAG TPA: ATP-binding protein [Myxococcota bacterium]|nr:ATP-binding protein [Myxococcota bacterium]HRY96606.1 ATP-binding protein [Myxococcota bacterium]
MKLEITGASNFVNRMFEACGKYQWARELLKNSIEAGATRVEFGIEWQAVAKHGQYRRTVADDGAGMDGEELLGFFSTLGAGAKKIGGVHDNFGVGAKIAALPWNPEGVVVISYKGGQGSMIWIVLDEAAAEYELVEFEVGSGRRCVIPPGPLDDGIDWAAVKPDWLQDHGTIVVLLGSGENPHTVLGNPEAGEGDIKGLSVYLNSRFWDLTGIGVKVAELRSPKPTQWPEGPEDRDNSRRPNVRRILGARHWLVEQVNDEGELDVSGEVTMAGGRVRLEWYLWKGERPAIHSYAQKPGYIAVRYHGELFDLSKGKALFRTFGVVESKVQQNLTLVLEPQLYKAGNGCWGVHPDQSRNRMIFTGDGEKGVQLPMSDWGQEFAAAMPESIREAIRQAQGELGGTVKDENYRKRLQDTFGDRWRRKVVVAPPPGQPGGEATGGAPGADVPVYEPPPSLPGGGGGGGNPSDRQRKKSRVLRRVLGPAGAVQGQEMESPVDVPVYRFGKAEDFEKPWHLAMWVANDQKGPTVVLNVEAPVLREIVQYHQDRHPELDPEAVQKQVWEVFGEVAVCKVAHSAKLDSGMSQEEFDKTYRSEQALTLALLGLLAEEAVIVGRLAEAAKSKDLIRPTSRIS